MLNLTATGGTYIFSFGLALELAKTGGECY